MKLSQRKIDRFVESKSAWIDSHIEKMANRNAQKEDFSLDYGSTVLYRGKEYPIVAHDDKRVCFDAERFLIPQGWESHEIQCAIVNLYKLLAKEFLPQRVAHFAEIMGVNPSAVKVNSAKTRWGSCSGTNSLNFSWRLILADDSVIDYVVIHELSHIKQHNHSPRFWEVVASVLPDFKTRQRKLKELQKLLASQDWD